MKGIPTFCRKLMFLRALLLTIFVLLFSFSGIYAKTVVIGAGSGSVAVQNMNGLDPGDVLAINPGSYSGATFSNLNGITITNNKGVVSFSGTVNLNTLVECSFTGFQFINIAGVAILWEGNSRRCVEKNIFFSNVLGDANNASDHNPYTGDTASLKLFMCTFDSLTLVHSGMVMMGSWGDAASGICFMDSLVFSRISVESTITNGTELRGTFFRLDAHDWSVIYKGNNPVLGDVGIFYMTGSAYIHNIFRNGGRGYIARIWHCGLKGQRAGDTYFYNNIDLNSSVYGSIDSRSESAEATRFTNGGNCFIYNNTAGNKSDNIGYWSSLAVAGTFVPPYKCEVRNNLGFNINSQSHPPILMDQGSGTIPDSSNNLYFAIPDGVVDPATGIPVANSPVLGRGLTVSWIPDDYYHNPRTGAYDVGAVQHGGPPVAQPPVANAGADQTITAPASSVSLNGTDSRDPDGSIAGYSWVKVSGPGSVTISNSNTATASVLGLQTGTYVFELTVTDNQGATDKDQVTITVMPAPDKPNQLPVANAGNNLTITVPENSISLNGTSSFDPDGSIIAFSWKEISGTSTATITGSNTSTPTVLLPEAGQYSFELTVTDNKGATNKDQVTVTVNPPVAKVNQAPVANAGSDDSVSLPVNTCRLDASRSLDPDGSISAYQWQEISGPNTVINTGLNSAVADISGLEAGEYAFQVTVTDNQGATATAVVKIWVVQVSGFADQLILYPNPAHDLLHGRIISNVTGTTMIKIFDMNGKAVWNGQLEKNKTGAEKTLAVSQLASGMYIMEVNMANKKSMTGKFIKN